MDQKPLAQPKARKYRRFEENRDLKVNGKFTQKPMFNPKLSIVFSKDWLGPAGRKTRGMTTKNRGD